MKLIGFLEYGGFGALVSRRLLITYLAEKYGRSAVIVYRNCLYDDPYTSEHTIPEGTEIVPFTYSKDQDDKYAFFDFDYYWSNKRLEYMDYSKSREEFDYIGKGKILNNFHLKDEYKLVIKNLETKYPQIKDSIALQIRRGDKTDETPYVPYQVYVDHCKSIRDANGINFVFLTSDSLSALLEVKELLEVEGFVCFFDEKEERYDNANYQMVQGNPNLKIQESLTGIKIIYFMSKAQHILGQKNTQFTQLAAMLQSYRTQSIGGFTLITPPEK